MIITDLLNEFGVTFKRAGESHHVTQNFIGTDCPYCSPQSDSYKLGFSIRGKAASCWTCGRVSYVETIAALTGLSLKEALRRCFEIQSDEAPAEFKPGKLKLPGGLVPLTPRQRSCLKRRGLDPAEVVKIWGFQGIGWQGRSLAGRLFIPIHYQNSIVSWTTRCIKKFGTRYLTAKKEDEAIPAKSILYGEDYAQHSVVVLEGPLDVVSVGPGAVGTCGVGYTQAQLLRISKFPVRAICFDSEPNAQRRAANLVRELAPFDGETYNVTLSHKDANETLIHNPADIKRLRKEFLK